MNTIKLIAVVFLVFFFYNIYGQKAYKHMMNDMNVNFYDVCKEAEKYFESHEKGKGSGWKGYQRWKNWNESRYYPSGERSNVDPYFLTNAYQGFLKNNPIKTSFTSGWNDLGPYDANNITTHWNPGIGRVEAFYVNPANTQQIYMGSRSGGFWRTADGGASWENTTDFLPASGVNVIDASPTNADSVYINLRNAANGTTHGIYCSGDAGATWSVTNFNPANLGWGGLGDNEKVYKIVHHPTIPGLIFVGTSNGLYRSTDNLQTWVQLLSTTYISDIEFHPASPNIMYVYDDYYWGPNQSLVLRSTDFGLTFLPSATISGNNDKEGFIAVSPACPNCVYFASDNGVWRSDDAAQTFTLLSNPNESCDGFAISDQDTLHMVYGYLDMHGSADGGYNFNKITDWSSYSPDSSYVHADLRVAECINGVFYVGTDGYLAKSPDNGISWSRLNDGTGIREFYAVGLSQSNWKVAMAGSQDNGTSVIDETGWIEWCGADGMEAIVQPLNDQWMIGSIQYGSRQRTQDGGQSRHGISAPQNGDGAWEAPLCLDPNNQMKIFHFVDTVYTSDEFGEDWDTAGTPNFSGNIDAAAVAYNNSDILVVTKHSIVELSQDGGQTFSVISGALPIYFITDVAFDPNDDNTIVITYNRYQSDNQKVYITHNMGQTWTNISYNLTDMPIRSVVIDHTDASNIYLGAEIGVFYKPMSGTNWILYNSGLPNTTVKDLEIQYGSNVIRAATWGRGLWEYTLVGRNDHPSILTTEITDPPTLLTPEVGAAQTVTSVISYANTLTSVYVKWSSDNPVFDSVIIMNNTVDSTWQTSTPIPDHFPGGTKIYFKVFAVGSSSDTTETYKFMYTVRAKEYCTSSGNMDYNTSITLVELSDISKTSAKTQAYSDYTATDTAHVIVSNSYDLTMNLNTDGNVVVHSMVWIDWNQDADFDDAGEDYDLGQAQNTANGATTLSPLSIVVPANAAIGTTRMRVSCRYNAAPTSCMTGVDGEVEDYSITVESPGLPVNKIPEGQVEIYPNPTKGDFRINLGRYYKEIIIEINDASGKFIKREVLKDKHSLNLSIDDVAAGVYMLNLMLDNAQGTYQLVKE